MATYSGTATGDTRAETGGTWSDTVRTLSALDDGLGELRAEAGGTWSDTVRTLSALDDGLGELRAEAGGTWSDTVRTLSASDDGLGGHVIGADGVIIPTGQFRDVLVVVEDENGNPIPAAEWVRSAGLFPTSGRVKQATDGTTYARLWLLSYEYDSLALTAREGGVVYVWEEIEGDDGRTGVLDTENEVTATFERRTKHGLDAGVGLDMGGSLSS